mmetsp:Transcript_2325/g.4947  ORF Transcript_2325/g.4947 Transcript_2325/m.4947 type:complete len:136 (-) Transcript_2325:36-443(-)
MSVSSCTFLSSQHALLLDIVEHRSSLELSSLSRAKDLAIIEAEGRHDRALEDLEKYCDAAVEEARRQLREEKEEEVKREREEARRHIEEKEARIEKCERRIADLEAKLAASKEATKRMEMEHQNEIYILKKTMKR